jgi:predicted RNA-binding protein
MTRKKLAKLVWGTALSTMLTGVALAGDVLLIEKVEERMLRDLPRNGLSQQQVEARYGAPNEKHAPVGEPPITRWVYDDFNVYFEHQLVIESVLHHDAIVRNARAQQEP